MQATFNIDTPNLLAEASADDLFVPLGPDLIECVCALKCAGRDAEILPAARFNPDALLAVVVVACRVGRGEPEYYPTGHTRMLFGATPIVFLRQVERLALAPRDMPATTGAADEPLYTDLTALQQHMRRVDSERLAATQDTNVLDAVKAAIAADDQRLLPTHFNPQREEFTSRL
ncbi:MAG: hypothetical protein J0H50_10560 [Xanthomonadales bacterium]|nr:hypothetical protein [Xanthomonadales bacterium]